MSSDQAVGEVINVATGHEISVGDTARLIAELMRVDIEIVPEAQRVRPGASEVERLCGDNAKAKRLLGWAPEFSGPEGLRKGIEETIAWFGNSANLARYRPGTYTL